MSLILGVLAATVLRQGGQSPDAAAIYKKVLPSVMTIHAKLPSGVSQGTAFLAFKDGLAVTCWHVMKGAVSATAKFSDGQEFEVSGVVDKDEKRDLALIRVKVADRPLLSFAKGDPEVGAKAFAVGSPLGLDFSISDGIVSQVRTEDGVKFYQFSSPVSPGNSGGPLIDANGDVMGVVRLQMNEGQNLNFAMPVAYVKGFDITLPTTPWGEVKTTATAPVGDAAMEKELIDDLKQVWRFAARMHFEIESLIESPFELTTAIALERAIHLAKLAETLESETSTGDLEVARNAVSDLMAGILEAFLRLRDCDAPRDGANQGSTASLVTYHERLQSFVAVFRSVSDENLKKALDLPGVANVRKALGPHFLAKVYGSPYPKGYAPRQDSIGRQRLWSPLPILARLALDVDSTGYVFGLVADSDNPAEFYCYTDDGYAYKWKIQPHDVVVSVEGKPVSSIEEMKIELIRLGKRKSEIVVKRAGKEVKLQLDMTKILE